jgi:WD40 repeat protein
MKAAGKTLFEPRWQGLLKDYVTAIAWAPDGQWLAASSAVGEVAIWDAQTRSLTRLTEGDGFSLDGLAFSADGQYLAAGGQSGKVQIWQMQPTPQPIAMLEYPRVWIDRLQWHPQQNELAFTVGRSAQVWDAATRQIVATLDFEASSVLGLAWRPQGDGLTLAGHLGIKTWNRQDWQQAPMVFDISASSVAIAWSPDGNYLASGNLDRTLLVWEWGNPYPWQMQGFPGKVGQLAWSDLLTAVEAPMLASSSVEGVVTWEKDDDDRVGWNATVLRWHEGKVRSIGFQPQSWILASAADDGSLALWQRAKTIAQVLTGASNGFSCLAWQPQGKLLAAGGQGGELVVWVEAKRGQGFGRR